MAVPNLLYGSDVWTLTTNNCKRAQATNMKVLLSLIKYTLNKGGYRNDDIRKEHNIFNK